MVNAKPCTVALLRPPETSYTAFFRQQSLELEGANTPQVYDPYIDDWCEMYRERIAEIGEEEGVPTEVKEHQLDDELPLPSRRSRRELMQEADVITAIDPPVRLAAFVLGAVSQRPNMRSVFAYSSRDALEDAYEALGTTKVPVLITREVRVGMIILLERETSLRMIPKMFAFVYRHEDQMTHAVRQALRYPDCKDVAAEWHSLTPATSALHTG
ncbi:MAG: hypothetical protein PHS73_00330 [Candidatus Peribacteraceae bacterium]|nr:hypothetical protein [Candidatus Peribacteraceae bacterium]